jgi:PAS domain S-box-containing protein
MKKEEALHEFEERVVLAAEAAHLGVWEMDPATNELWMSDSARTLFEFDPETPLDHAAFQDRIHPEDRSLRDSAVKHALETRSGYEMEYRVLLPDGTQRWIGARARWVAGDNRKGARLIGVSIDITPRKLAEAEAQRQRDELSHLSRVALMGEMSASIAHELNQPLAGILSNAAAGQRFIDRGNVDQAEIHELLGDIISDGRRASDVVRGIRGMVKKGQVEHRSVNLNEVVMDAVRMVSADALLRSCQVETSLDTGLRAVEADPVQLQQVLLNLVINAFDAMRDTPISRRKVLIATQSNGDGAVCATVRDYGVGISAEMQDRLFDPFFTTKNEGLGMGLAIARSILESHGGAIAVKNADGGGARFEVVLPANGPST